ncbi:RNA-guided endonuclease TnpB family protein [Neobacillus cucumis]|uniref:RNA-guided endonuclease TnpB family protein n=1 Tax=Neobacillus cucumis TaxID=1740721 RepID=UPI001962BAA3|nr:RNA-guided endonuclease TnpB family protein [Neobacillus cucumis]
MDKFRKGVEARRISVQRQGKYCGEGRKGHGRNTRIKPIEKLNQKVQNFKNTTNHRYSKFVVDTAVLKGCGVIQMEDLTKIADGDKKETFLGAWPYYDLQRKIEYKAKEKGIKIRYINPAYTSQRCSKCGYICKENRESQEVFKCKNNSCGYSANADFNAARNISLNDI